MVEELRGDYNKWHKAGFDPSAERAERKENEKVLKLLKIKPGQKVLDLGCGKGGFCNLAFSKGLDVYGLDFSEVALKDAKEVGPSINYVLSDALKIPFKDRFFDYVLCLGSFEHFTDKAFTLKEIHRILKEDGTLFMFLPNSFFLGHIYMALKTGLPPEEAGQQFSEEFNTKMGWKNLLEKNHFKIISIEKFNTIWASRKVGIFTKYIYNFLIKPFIPSNLSYAFGYLCKKNGKSICNRN